MIQQRLNVQKDLLRTLQPTGLGKTLCSSILSEADEKNWPQEAGHHFSFKCESDIPPNYISIACKVIRDVLLEKEKLPTIYEMYSCVSKKTVLNVQPLNLFDDKLSPSDSLV